MEFTKQQARDRELVMLGVLLADKDARGSFDPTLFATHSLRDALEQMQAHDKGETVDANKLKRVIEGELGLTKKKGQAFTEALQESLVKHRTTRRLSHLKRKTEDAQRFSISSHNGRGDVKETIEGLIQYAETIKQELNNEGN